jgi:DNA polymerase delta subunit 1
MYTAHNIQDLRLIYSILRERFPTKQIHITKSQDEYTLKLTNDTYSSDPTVQLGLDLTVVYGDTDSIFIQFKFNRDDHEENRRDTFKFAELCGEQLTHRVFNRKPIEMEFEKVFQPFILLTKKRYIGKKYEDLSDPFKMKEITTAGIALTRRDYCRFVKDCYTRVIDDIVNRADLPNSIRIYKSFIDDIKNYNIPLESLVLSSQLAKTYKTNPVHVILAEKLKKRKQEVQIGDRVPYVFIECNDPRIKKSELGEDPGYIKEHGLKFNRSCYLEQLAKPLLGFFKVVMNDRPKELQDLVDYTNERLVSFGGHKLKNSDFMVFVDAD